MEMDLSIRSWAKSVTWRLIGILILGGLTYAATGDWKETGAITLLFNGIRFILYYFHERAWDRIPWGTCQHPLSCLPVRRDLAPGDYETIQDFLARHRFVPVEEAR
jgi:uncharacterized membrane protein